MSVDITWAPQKIVWIALGLSGLGVLACVGLILWPLVRRRARASDAAAGSETAVLVPELAAPWQQDGPSLSWGASIVATVLAGAGGLLFGSPVIGGSLAVLTLVACRVPRGQVALRVVSLAMFAGTAAFVVIKQLRNDFVVDFNWVGRFETAHGWTLLAVFAMFAAVVVDALRERRRSGDDPGAAIDD